MLCLVSHLKGEREKFDYFKKPVGFFLFACCSHSSSSVAAVLRRMWLPSTP